MTPDRFQDRGALEFSPLDQIRRAQEELLRTHLAYAASCSPYYRALFQKQRIDVRDITLASLSQLPLTTKNSLGERNDEFLAVPLSRIVDIVLSSGTTGRSTTVMYTDADLQRLAYNEQISFAGCGLTPADVVLLTCTMDRCFVAGLAYFSGVRSLGAAAIRNGLSSVDSHLEIIRRLKPTVLVGVPAFLLKLGLYLESEGLDPASTGVARLVCIGEPIRDRQLAFLKVGEKLEKLWGARIYSTYASSETITSFCECTAQQGGHLHPDLAVVEIVNERGEPLPPGETGEVVVTPLAIEGMPLVRFKTGDISFLMDEPCCCGRNSPRLGPILGRKNQMIKLRGTSFYPNSINAVLDSYPGISEYYVAASSDSDLSDEIKVFVSVGNASCSAEKIMDKLQAHLRVRPEVIIASEEQVKSQVYPGNARKLTRFVDKRKSL
ncbi:MAG: AMP-binding protein [Desulfuromonadales bacterium]|nr:AMP-binding protein [Desulfuromonadales bacterium]